MAAMPETEYDLSRLLPVDDFGLRAAIRRCDGLAELPTRTEVRERGAVWAPYRSVATWYLWQSLKVAPAVDAK